MLQRNRLSQILKRVYYDTHAYTVKRLSYIEKRTYRCNFALGTEFKHTCECINAKYINSGNKAKFTITIPYFYYFKGRETMFN